MLQKNLIYTFNSLQKYSSKLKLGLYLFVLSLLFGACEYTQPWDVVPAYIKIDKVDFNSELGPSFSDQRIEDVYVFVGGKFMGGYKLPALIPTTILGQRDIAIYGGIYADGVRLGRVMYPFFTGHIDTLNFEPGKTYEFTPVLNYVGFMARPPIVAENFENPSQVFDPFQSNTRFRIVNHPTVEPFIGAGRQYLEARSSANDTVNLMQIATRGVFTGLQNNRTSYLEFQYKSNTELAVGLVVIPPRGVSVTDTITAFDLILNATDNWTKVYCTLEDEATLSPRNSQFKILFRSIADGKQERFFAIDNVRTLSYQ